MAKAELITVRKCQAVVILDFSAGALRCQEVVAIQSEIDKLVKSGVKKILLNLTDARELDETGLGGLIYAGALNQIGRIEIKLLNPSEVVCSVLKQHFPSILRKSFDSPFPMEIHTSENDALAAFK